MPDQMGYGLSPQPLPWHATSHICRPSLRHTFSTSPKVMGCNSPLRACPPKQPVAALPTKRTQVELPGSQHCAPMSVLVPFRLSIAVADGDTQVASANFFDPPSKTRTPEAPPEGGGDAADDGDAEDEGGGSGEGEGGLGGSGGNGGALQVRRVQTGPLS